MYKRQLVTRSLVEPRAVRRACRNQASRCWNSRSLLDTPWAHGYVAAKWDVRGLTKSVGLELASQRVRVNSVHPGLIKTPLTEHFPDDLIPIPLGLAGHAHRGREFVFIANDESSFATGAEFVVDGGTVHGIPHKT